ncbi:hypothetical protein FB45DRAFT_761277 [Roridomyces roridus]|uniref:Tyr recombinase domain-containing protein n=1 Tax=Roridomyces roridus TaxID=1738132 RepID=A0AAD7F5E0_9AGAR|nr:hypothetical protein FB45DRAFT_775377 [Roridomyces roridus]KAJ7610399.1 hypothetical protein FB45DRAFT_761277 [Roridomyces roridus]
MDIAELQGVLAEASKGVTEDTDKEYKRQVSIHLAIARLTDFRLMNKCREYLISVKLIKPGDAFFTKNPGDLTPLCICLWIMSECDEINPDGTAKPHTETRNGYVHAQKMRAAMTYAFGRIHGLGSLTWHRSEVSGRMMGNPSVSDTVAIYMTSLRRRKVRAGQTATSSRAITAEIIRELYNYNHQPDVGDIKSYTPGRRSAPKKDHEWAGGRMRRLLQCTYVLAFLCLLRFDEVLKIRLEDIQFVTPTCVKLTLPFRKTHQFGNVQPFYLYLLPEPLAYLCPVRALAEWLEVLGAAGVDEGYLFRKIGAGDRISVNNEHMVRVNLSDIWMR